ncbi:MAG: hypothetical protein R6X29_02020 [Acidimicrobiia bacterium]
MIEKLASMAGLRGGSATGQGGVMTLGYQRDDDLPCPWCHAPTAEFDPRCPSCGRRFG